MRKDDRDNFKRLAEQRVNKAIKQLRLVGNLSNRSNYDYTEKDVEKIFSTLGTELKASRARFTEKGGSSENEFKLD